MVENGSGADNSKKLGVLPTFHFYENYTYFVAHISQGREMIFAYL